jgi:hypothetical protein
MEKKYSILFENMEPSKHLKQNVLLKIEKERQRQDLQRKMLFWSLFFIAGISFIGAVSFFGNEILTSEFWNLASLGFTDMQYVVIFWQDYAFSLMETFPILPTLSILFPVFMMLFALKKYEDSEMSDLKYKLIYKV